MSLRNVAGLLFLLGSMTLVGIMAYSMFQYSLLNGIGFSAFVLMVVGGFVFYVENLGYDD